MNGFSRKRRGGVTLQLDAVETVLLRHLLDELVVLVTPVDGFEAARRIRALGLPRRVTTPNGAIIEYVYDERGRTAHESIDQRASGIRVDLMPGIRPYTVQTPSSGGSSSSTPSPITSCMLGLPIAW